MSQQYNPFGSKILNGLFCTGPVSDRNQLLKTEVDSEFLILSSKLNQYFNVEGKKILETICSPMEDWYMTVSCSYNLFSRCCWLIP